MPKGQYGDCTVEAADLGSQDPASLDIQRQLWDTNCQLRFVVSEVTVEDHIEIPPLGG